MTRKEQIKQAAHDLNYDLTSSSFIEGAQWADANPNCPCLMNQGLLVAAEKQVEIAMEALSEYSLNPFINESVHQSTGLTAAKAIAMMKSIKELG